MSTVRDLTSVGVMETKTQPFGTLGGFEGNLPPVDGSPHVFTNTTDNAVLSTKIFNFGHGSFQYPAGQTIGQTNEICLQPYRLGMPVDATPSDDVAAAGVGPSQVIGKQIFARNSHMTIHLRYAVPRMPYQWQATGGTAAPTGNAAYWRGSPVWYTPINYRLLLVKFKRDKWPSAGNNEAGGELGFFGAPVLDNASKEWYRVNQLATGEGAFSCVQSPLNRCLFIDHYGGYFGVGNLPGAAGSTPWANQKFTAYEAMTQPVATKYWDVIHEKKGTIKPPAILPEYDVEFGTTAGVINEMTAPGQVPTTVFGQSQVTLGNANTILPGAPPCWSSRRRWLNCHAKHHEPPGHNQTLQNHEAVNAMERCVLNDALRPWRRIRRPVR